MTTVLNCIERIPEKLNNVLKQRKERFCDLSSYIEKRKVDKVIFIASGTSYNGAFTTRLFYEMLGIPTQFIYPNIFVNYTNIMDDHALYVVISQGGTTKLVYDALEKLKSKGYANCSITESLVTPIAKHADIALEMGSDGEEFLYRTLGYSTTVATCYMMALTIALSKQLVGEKDIQKYEEDYQKAVNHLPHLQTLAKDWFLQHRFSMMHKHHVMFAGTANLLPVVQEADIKFMEMIPMITRSFELEEFIHGPQNAFDANTVYFLLAQKNQDEEKVKAIAKFLKNEIGFCSVVGDYGEDERDIPFTTASTYFAPLEYITIMQILAYEMAESHGRDLTRGVNTSIQKYIKKTL